eukprot:scaffold24489_cov147-Cylindrotheca_fusiformis.AAC.1
MHAYAAAQRNLTREYHVHSQRSFLSEGLGSSIDALPLCIQDLGDPKLRICCGWEKQTCKSMKAARIEKEALNISLFIER